MQYHWFGERSDHQQFKIFWDHGHNNEADFTAKFHPPNHTIRMRELYLHKLHNVRSSASHITTSPVNVRLEGVFLPCGLSVARNRYKLVNQGLNHYGQLIIAP